MRTTSERKEKSGREVPRKPIMLIDQLTTLWDEHLKAEFPSDCLGQEIQGVELVLLDTDVAGCISTYLGSKGKLDAQGLAILRSCYRDLAVVLPLLQPEAAAYFQRIDQMVSCVLGSVG